MNFWKNMRNEGAREQKCEEARERRVDLTSGFSLRIDACTEKNRMEQGKKERWGESRE
jgi:hypothetical protein